MIQVIKTTSINLALAEFIIRILLLLRSNMQVRDVLSITGRILIICPHLNTKSTNLNFDAINHTHKHALFPTLP